MTGPWLNLYETMDGYLIKCHVHGLTISIVSKIDIGLPKNLMMKLLRTLFISVVYVPQVANNDLFTHMLYGLKERAWPIAQRTVVTNQ